MNTIHEEISQAVALFRESPDLSEERIYHALVDHGVDRKHAARLVAFLPSVYCRLMLRNSGAKFSNMFRRSQPGDISQELPLSSDPIWNAALAFASAELQSGVSKMDIFILAARSAEFDAANQLLNRGSKLEDIVFNVSRCALA